MKLPETSTRTRAFAAVALMVLAATHVGAQTEPRGGQPPLGTQPSVPDLEAQVAYQRAFEAVVWAMPASAIHRLRVGFLEVPCVDDNVVIAYVAPLPQAAEVITGNTGLARVQQVEQAHDPHQRRTLRQWVGRSPWPACCMKRLQPAKTR